MQNIHISDSRLIDHLQVTGKWTRRLGVTLFAFFGLGVLVMLGLMLFAGFTSEMASLGFGFGSLIFIGLFYLLIFGVYFYVLLKFYRFGMHLKTMPGQGYTNEKIRDAFSELASFFKILVVLTALFFVLYFVMLFFMLTLGLGALIGS